MPNGERTHRRITRHSRVVTTTGWCTSATCCRSCSTIIAYKRLRLRHFTIRNQSPSQHSEYQNLVSWKEAAHSKSAMWIEACSRQCCFHAQGRTYKNSESKSMLRETTLGHLGYDWHRHSSCTSSACAAEQASKAGACARVQVYSVGHSRPISPTECRATVTIGHALICATGCKAKKSRKATTSYHSDHGKTLANNLPSQMSSITPSLKRILAKWHLVEESLTNQVFPTSCTNPVWRHMDMS